MSKTLIPNEANENFHWLEKILVSGPFLIGWLYGFLKFSPQQRLFQISFFSFLIFIAYLFLLGFFRLIMFFFFDLQLLFLFNSIFSAIYLLMGFLNLYMVFFHTKGKKILFWSNGILKKIFSHEFIR